MERIAGITSNTVPWEILRAAGYTPRLLEDEPGATPVADRFMEDVFDRRIRVIFDRLCSGAWSDVEVVVIPRTSEQEHKLYLYLREMSRLGHTVTMPRLYLYNLLHTRNPDSYEYGLERTRQMVRDFGASDSGLREAIAEGNQARAAVRKVLQWRQEGRIEGSAALGVISGFYTENRNQFAANVSEPPLECARSRPRILIKGVPLNDTCLHQFIERCGGYVIAEDDWRGSRAAGETDVRTGGDPVIAIFEKYYCDTSSPRVHPSEEADTWFHKQVEQTQIDGVVFHVPLEDDVAGWDHPRHLSYLSSLGIPSFLIRDRANEGELATFIGGLGDR